jgi:hypothetical protein
MADELAFIDKLDPQQREIAFKVITKAKEYGIDPRFAVTLAYVESNLRMDAVSPKGAIGVMQVMPPTGKMLGVDPKELKDLDTNIETGMRYLKQGVDRYASPKLAAIGYNAGHDHPFLLGESEKPPEESLNYVNKINELGGFTPTPAKEEAGAPKPPSDIVPASVDHMRSLQAAQLGGGIGAGLGLTSAIGSAILGPSPSSAPAPTGMTGVEKWTASQGYSQRGAPTMAQAHQAEQGIRKGATIRNPATGEARSPTFRFNKPPVIETPPLQGALNMGKAVLNSAPVKGGLAGAGVAGLGQETVSRFNAGDPTGAAIAGVGAAGSALSLVPHPLTSRIGAGLSMASPAALMVLDKMREKSTEDRPMLGMPQP